MYGDWKTLRWKWIEKGFPFDAKFINGWDKDMTPTQIFNAVEKTDQIKEWLRK